MIELFCVWYDVKLNPLNCSNCKKHNIWNNRWNCNSTLHKDPKFEFLGIRGQCGKRISCRKVCHNHYEAVDLQDNHENLETFSHGCKWFNEIISSCPVKEGVQELEDSYQKVQCHCIYVPEVSSWEILNLFIFCQIVLPKPWWGFWNSYIQEHCSRHW